MVLCTSEYVKTQVSLWRNYPEPQADMNSQCSAQVCEVLEFRDASSSLVCHSGQRFSWAYVTLGSPGYGKGLLGPADFRSATSVSSIIVSWGAQTTTLPSLSPREWYRGKRSPGQVQLAVQMTKVDLALWLWQSKQGWKTSYLLRRGVWGTSHTQM